MHATCYIVCGYVAINIKELQDVCMYACKSKAYSGWGMYTYVCTNVSVCLFYHYMMMNHYRYIAR